MTNKRQQLPRRLSYVLAAAMGLLYLCLAVLYAFAGKIGDLVATSTLRVVLAVVAAVVFVAGASWLDSRINRRS